MIFCKKCEFEVNNGMRHSLVKNCCPCCGSALLGDLHMRRLELMKRKILEQEFSHELSTELVFDISLFMLSEFFPSAPEADEVDETADETADVEEPVVMEYAEEDYDSIRDEIRNEILKDMDDNPLEDTDADLKVARLKRIAKESRPLNPGAIVRRVGD